MKWGMNSSVIGNLNLDILQELKFQCHIFHSDKNRWIQLLYTIVCKGRFKKKHLHCIQYYCHIPQIGKILFKIAFLNTWIIFMEINLGFCLKFWIFTPFSYILVWSWKSCFVCSKYTYQSFKCSLRFCYHYVESMWLQKWFGIIIKTSDRILLCQKMTYLTKK